MLQLSLRCSDSAKNNPVDVFVSHTGANKESYAAPVANYLKRHGKCVFIDKALAIGSKGDDEMMMRAAVTCKYFWCVLSEDFVKQWYPMRELLIGLTRHMREDGNRFCLLLDCLEQGYAPKGLWMEKVLRLQSLKLYRRDGAPHPHPAGMQVARTLEPFDERIIRIASSEFADGQVLTTVKELSGEEPNSVTVDLLNSLPKELSAMHDGLVQTRALVEDVWKEVQETRTLLRVTTATAEIDLGDMQPVMAPRRYDVFISHAGPDKRTLAEPLYRSLERHNVRTFLDMEELQINNDTTPEAMVRAMREASIGIFLLSPEFAGREWTLKELRHFLERNERCKADGVPRPVLLPVFYRLSISGCWTVYGDDSEHRTLLTESGFFRSEQQAKCSTDEAKAALQGLTGHSGVEMGRIGGGEDLSSAAVAAKTVRRVVDYMQEKGLI